MKKAVIIIIFCFMSANAFSQLRSFNAIFPNISADARAGIFSDAGYVMTSRRTTGFIILGSSQNSNLHSSIVSIPLGINPGYIVESISIIPGVLGSVSLLDIYNALGNIRDLQGRLYNSATRGQEIPLFEDATRITSERQTTAIPDPPAARTLPGSETVYIRLRDVNFGNTFYRAEMAIVQGGLRYTMTNFRAMSYMLVPVIREGRFIAQLYIEPIQEGVLIYSIAGTDISDFFASRIHVDSAISKRLAIITEWASDGIRGNR